MIRIDENTVELTADERALSDLYDEQPGHLSIKDTALAVLDGNEDSVTPEFVDYLSDGTLTLIAGHIVHTDCQTCGAGHATVLHFKSMKVTRLCVRCDRLATSKSSHVRDEQGDVRWITLLVMAVIGCLIGAWLSPSRGSEEPPPVEPAIVLQGQPYGGCDEAWQAPRSEGARWCRNHGWLVGARYVVSPRKVLRFYHLPSCRFEDGSGQPMRGGNRNCGWNVTEGDGDGRGKVYLVLGMGENRRFVDLRVCSAGKCRPWVR